MVDDSSQEQEHEDETQAAQESHDRGKAENAEPEKLHDRNDEVRIQPIGIGKMVHQHGNAVINLDYRIVDGIEIVFILVSVRKFKERNEKNRNGNGNAAGVGYGRFRSFRPQRDDRRKIVAAKKPGEQGGEQQAAVPCKMVVDE